MFIRIFQFWTNRTISSLGELANAKLIPPFLPGAPKKPQIYYCMTHFFYFHCWESLKLLGTSGRQCIKKLV